MKQTGWFLIGKKGMTLMLFLLGCVFISSAYRVHCAEDSLKVIELISVAGSDPTAPLGERMVKVAKALAGTPGAKASDNDSIGTVMVNLHGFTHLEFINNVMAIAKASQKNNPGFKDYVSLLENVSRRGGTDTGFASRHFYGGAWIVDNIVRGNLKEMTEYVTGGDFRTKTYDYITRHADEFPAMKDSLVRENVKMMEMGYRSHRLPHLKKQSIGNKNIKELMKTGDIIMMLVPENDYDIYDIGIVEMKDDGPYMIHILTETGNLEEDSNSLPRRFKIENQHFYGYRWLRPE